MGGGPPPAGGAPAAPRRYPEHVQLVGVDEGKASDRKRSRNPPQRQDFSTTAEMVNQITACQGAGKIHSQDQRAKSKAGGERFTTLHQHRGYPTGQAVDPEHDRKRRTPSGQSRPAVGL